MCASFFFFLSPLRKNSYYEQSPSFIYSIFLWDLWDFISFSVQSFFVVSAHSVLSFTFIYISWWHLWPTGWCGLYQDEKQRYSTRKMYTPLYISQQAQRSSNHWLFYVSPVVQVWWQASCDNYTLAAIQSIGTHALISQIKQGFVFTLLKTHSLADN